MNEIAVLVVDDEPLARASIRLLLERDASVSHIEEASCGSEALERLEHREFDIVFLDVQMPELDGLAVAAALPEPRPAVVFVTAFDTYAVRAFEVHAIDYILKPFTDTRFEEALERAKVSRAVLTGIEAAAIAEEIEAARRQEPLRRLLVRAGEESVVIRTDEIDWIEAADYYARIHVGARRYLVRESLTEFEKKLDPACFFRVHRSAIVNLERVTGIRNAVKDEGVAVLKGDVEVPLARSRRERFERTLGKIR